MASALELAQGDERLLAAVRRGRRLLHGKAMVAAAASAVPVPGLDWAVDAAVLSRLIPAVSAKFGLTPEQIGRLEPRQRDQVQKAVNMVGSVLIGKFITRDLVLKAAAHLADSRDRSRHLLDAVTLLACIVDGGAILEQLRGSDRSRLRHLVRAFDDHPLVVAQAPSDTATLARRTLDELRDGGL